ncbi:glycosyl hydrolase [Cryptococcus deuterogattii R265]|uniref:lytic cellulose monooxygenase (C4-dehydrogenating) n=1 Tax=Cryptococcus deuterogattii (strain R265) TaxID=294750 RepID=A0A095C4H2_CRYD2|nr:glycosyl hydrolase [Cryptococcus deuterogattii R265]KIR72816.1 glycosyl hydrolase [Cryptococcus deuterogattii CA1014]KIS00475.1 glycosyl hydrolase [Cryptococcus deuterogattii 2001/935-1]
MLALSLAFALTVTLLCPVLVAAHGQLSWVQIGSGPKYPAWTLDDYYTALYRESDPVWGALPETRYTRKTDRLDLGFADIFSKSIATGGYEVCKRFDEMSPVGSIHAKAGDLVTVQWSDWPTGHPGPIGEWMAKCPYDSCTQVDATTLEWFCIAQHNYDADTKKWPTEILTELQDRQWTFTLPTDLPSGAYLIRHELIALHNSTGPTPDLVSSPQHYPIGIEIILESSGTTLPTLTCKFPGCFSHDDYEWHHSIWDDGWQGLLVNWEFPGIAVYPGGYTTGVVNGASAAARHKTSSSSSSSSPSSSSSVASSDDASGSTASSGVVADNASTTNPPSSSSINAVSAMAPGKKTCKRKKRSNTAGRKRHIQRSRVAHFDRH